MKSTVIVYGATGAVGTHTANLLHERNYGLHLVGRDPGKLETLGSDLKCRYYGRRCQ